LNRDQIIELIDVNGNVVRVSLPGAIAAIGDRLRDDESYLVPRNTNPPRYVKVMIVADSEVPG
jgi:hypothetical protein